MLTTDCIFSLKHIISDLENMNVLIDNYHDELLTLEDKKRYYLVMCFVEYSINRFRSFMENRKYFDESVKCGCYKCTTIGYSNPRENSTHIIENTEKLRNSLLDVKRMIKLSFGNYDAVYLIRFIKFCNYFLCEFKNITMYMENV